MTSRTKAQLFDEVEIIPECQTNKRIQRDDLNKLTMRCLKETSLNFFVDPDSKEKLSVYPDIVKSFYRTLRSISNDRLMYEVKITGIRVSFTTAEICFSLGFSIEYTDNIGFGAPIFVTADEIIEDMCRGRRTMITNSTRRSFLPSKMWMLDDAVRYNLCPIGHEQQRHENFLRVLYYMYKQV